MTCHEVRLRLVRYADNDLPAADFLAVDTHLDHCYLCIEELKDIVTLLDSCRDALRHPCPADRFDALRPQMRYLRPETRRRTRTVRRLVSVAALAASIVIIFSVGNSVMETARRFVSVAERVEVAPEPESVVAEPQNASMPPLDTWRQRILWAQALSIKPPAPEPETAAENDESDPKPLSSNRPCDGRVLLADVLRASRISTAPDLIAA